MMLARRAAPIVAISTISCLSGCGVDPLYGDGAEEVESAPEGLVSCPATSPRAGKLDVGFGAKGITRIRFGADDDGAYEAIDVAADGLVAAGFGAGGLGAVRFRLSKLDASGRVEPSFGDHGAVSTGFAASTADDARAVAVGHRRDGDIVAIGTRGRFHGASSDIALVRYARDGSLAGAQFGQAGKSLIDLGADEETTDGLVLLDDRILMVGRRGDELFVARADEAGRLDRSFAKPNGYLAVHVGRSVTARAVSLDAEGRILVAGTADMGGRSAMVVLRVFSDGALDGAFGQGGIIVIGGVVDERAVAVAPFDGGLVIVAGDSGPQGSRAPLVRRFLPDGAPDNSYGTGGASTVATQRGNTEAAAMVVLPRGGILLGGNMGEGHPVLVRYRCDGGLDSSFGAGGFLGVDFGEQGVLRALRLFSNDRVLLGGGDPGGTPGPGTYGVIARMWL